MVSPGLFFAGVGGLCVACYMRETHRSVFFLVFFFLGGEGPISESHLG